VPRSEFAIAAVPIVLDAGAWLASQRTSLRVTIVQADSHQQNDTGSGSRINLPRETSMSDLVLSIIATGTPQHPRFMISDSSDNFWTGSDWTEHESDGCLFANVNDAGRAIQKILLAEYGQKPMRRFVAPVYVDLYSETDVTLDQIRDWLVKVSRLTVAEMHGNGPVEDSLGLTMIDWSKLKETNTD
jgi:hypothetical protein